MCKLPGPGHGPSRNSCKRAARAELSRSPRSHPSIPRAVQSPGICASNAQPMFKRTRQATRQAVQQAENSRRHRMWQRRHRARPGHSPRLRRSLMHLPAKRAPCRQGGEEEGQPTRGLRRRARRAHIPGALPGPLRPCWWHQPGRRQQAVQCDDKEVPACSGSCCASPQEPVRARESPGRPVKAHEGP